MATAMAMTMAMAEMPAIAAAAGDDGGHESGALGDGRPPPPGRHVHVQQHARREVPAVAPLEIGRAWACFTVSYSMIWYDMMECSRLDCSVVWYAIVCLVPPSHIWCHPGRRCRSRCRTSPAPGAGSHGTSLGSGRGRYVQR